jgi:hypothetical protein
MSEPEVCFVAASGQNVFFHELQEALREQLDTVGVRTSTAVDHFPLARDELVYVVVPHEFFALTEPRAHPAASQLRRTIALETEQPGTHWFDHAAGVAAQCAATVDINRLAVRELRRRGIDARYMPLGYVPSWDCWGARTEAERPVDLTFMGGHTPRRAAVLGRCADFLTGRRVALHMTETVQPHTRGSAHFLAGARKWRHLARSKAIVNIHRDELAYFEWQRVIEAVINGCVVVTEHSLGYEPLEPGQHFVSAGHRNLPHVLEEVLEDEALQERIRREAYELLRTHPDLGGGVDVLREAVDDVLAAAPRVPPRAAHIAPRPAPQQPALPPIEYVRVNTGRDDLAVLRMAVKHLLLDQRDLRRQLAQGGDDDAPTVERVYGPYHRASPRVSVLVTVYNYEHAVGEALLSVAASSYRDFEIVVLDDASTDGSVAAVQETLAALRWVPALHVVGRHNAGLAAARNLAAERARGEYVFVLDADNAVYPHALERLVAALDADPGAALAYGILAKHADGEGAVDLMSWLGWDPGRLRFGNYIDAMVMIRRDALLESGGYTGDSRLHGWEDFALWCAFAQAGRRGVRVPEVVARYNAAIHSMITVTNIDASEAYAALARAYPFMAGAELDGASASSLAAAR